MHCSAASLVSFTFWLNRPEDGDHVTEEISSQASQDCSCGSAPTPSRFRLYHGPLPVPLPSLLPSLPPPSSLHSAPLPLSPAQAPSLRIPTPSVHQPPEHTMSSRVVHQTEGMDAARYVSHLSHSSPRPPPPPQGAHAFLSCGSIDHCRPHGSQFTGWPLQKSSAITPLNYRR